MSYLFQNATAFDPYSGEGVPNASGQVFAMSDTAFATPLAVILLSSGLQTTELVSDQYSQLPAFDAGDNVQVRFRSGEFVKILNTSTPLVGPQGDAGKSAYQVAVEGGYTGTEAEYNATLTDAPSLVARAETAETAAVDAAKLVGAPADAAIATAINGPGTQTHTTMTTLLEGVARIGPENMFSGYMAGALSDPTAVQGDPAFDGGYMNTFYGAEVGSKNLRGWKNTAFGTWALRDNVDGYNNVAIGDAALERNIGGVGTASPGNTDPGARNVAVGSYALRYNQTGWANVGIGRNSAHTNVSGAYNTAVGTNAYSGQYSNGVGDEKSASFNTMLGYNAGFFTNADKNTAVGNQSLYSNTTGVENTVIGSEAGYGLQTGSFNLIGGARALRQNPAGGSNTALGTGAMGNSTAGSRNTAVGTSSLAVPTGGGSNVALGYEAGSTTPAGNNYTTSIGTQAEANHDNSVAIGYATKTNTTYQMNIGTRSLFIGHMVSLPPANPNGASLWVEMVSGKSVLKARFGTGPIINIAQEA